MNLHLESGSIFQLPIVNVPLPYLIEQDNVNLCELGIVVANPFLADLSTLPPPARRPILLDIRHFDDPKFRVAWTLPTHAICSREQRPLVY